jgi:hypothetical protein
MTHIAMVRVYCGGAIAKPGEPVDYAGPRDWKYRPVDPLARADWERTTADPARVAEANGEDISLDAAGYARGAAAHEMVSGLAADIY